MTGSWVVPLPEVADCFHVNAVEFKCPNCHSVIYSRKRNTCGQCGEDLPAHLLFTPEQVRNLEKQRRAEKKRADSFNLPDSGQWDALN